MSVTEEDLKFEERLTRIVQRMMIARMALKEEHENETLNGWWRHYERDVGFLLQALSGNKKP